MCFPELDHCIVEHKSCLTLIIKLNFCWKPHGSSRPLLCVYRRREQPRQALTFPALCLFPVGQMETRTEMTTTAEYIYVCCSTHIRRYLFLQGSACPSRFLLWLLVKRERGPLLASLTAIGYYICHRDGHGIASVNEGWTNTCRHTNTFRSGFCPG